MPPRDMRQLIDESHEVQRMFMDRYLSIYVAQTLRISALTYSVATEKLLHTLRYLCVRFGNAPKDGKIELNIYLTHQQLAELLGLSRETTTNELIKLKKRGVINYDRKRITVFVSQLSEAIGSLDADELTLRG
jgi:CRP/FNR family transcriptional regulator